ncbi:tudor domain-containing protein 7B-like isoform X2 [Homarus americanus]|uniref:tudor domain-containing protein 7B-like isoform X2 n=1 Tax=Homarus americanus TaxID=6706 RepID=UPI001C46FD3F|nr:tudor domain-containing protein 7B-like isoform X2 [Homarus americanus]
MADLTQKQEELLTEVTNCLKALLTAFGGEVQMDKLGSEYRKVVGTDIPYRQLNHSTIASFLQSIDKVATLKNRGGILYVQMVNDKSVDNILKMVREQKTSRGSRKHFKPARQPRGPSAWQPGAPRVGPRYGPPVDGAFRVRRGRTELAPKPNNPKPNNLPGPKHPLIPNIPYSASHIAASKQHPTFKPNLPLQSETTEAKHSNQALKPGQYYNDGNWNIPRTIRGNQEKQFAPYYVVPPRFTNNAKNTESKPIEKTNKQKLQEEVQKLNEEQKPVFRTIPWGKKKQNWLSTVSIGKIKVSSYPEEMERPEDAEELVAKNALPLIQQLIKQSLPITTNLEVSLQRVKVLLKKENMWWPRVQELYQDKYQEQLPEDYFQKIQNHDNCGIFVENLCSDRWVLRLAEEVNQVQPSSVLPESGHCNVLPQEKQQYHGQPHLHSPKMSEELCASTRKEEPQLPPIKLPCGNFWDILVIHVEDFNCVNFRLVGPEYTGAHDDLVTDMELYYMEEKNLSPVTGPSVGGIYAAGHEESWFRVKVLSISGDKVMVLFMDHGDKEEIDLTKLHHLQKRFFYLPPQHLRCSLAGLEYARRDKSSLALLQDLALGQPLVAQVINRQEHISLILFNTMTDEDININQKVSDHLQHNFVEPTLPSVGGVAEVYLMHVTPEGDVFVQIESETYEVLESLLDVARHRAKEMLGENVQIDLTRLYLARFSEDGEWYRAAPRSNIDQDGKVQMWFVDFGNSDQVDSTNIRLLESDQLKKIPHQALQCRLHNVPSTTELQWTIRACQRLIELSPEDVPLLLRVHTAGTNGGPPMVELFKRIQPQNELVSINATLSMDTSLFSCDGDRNNNNFEKEVILSPTRTRSRRSSATSQSSSSHGSLFGSAPASPHLKRISRPESPFDLSSRQKTAVSLVPQEIPRVGDFFDVFVTYAANPSNFAVQSWKMTQKLSSLMSDLQNYYEDKNNKQSVVINVREYYAVKHNDDTWYRATISMIQEDIVAGVFVDYGDCFVSSRDRVLFFFLLPFAVSGYQSQITWY